VLRPLEPKQYTSLRLTEHLALEEIRPSIGSVGDAYDNALMECINGLYKTECIRTTVFHDGPYKTIGDVEYATAEWSPGHVQGSMAPWDTSHPGSTSKPLRCPQPRAATRTGPAENLGASAFTALSGAGSDLVAHRRGHPPKRGRSGQRQDLGGGRPVEINAAGASRERSWRAAWQTNCKRARVP